MWRKAFKTEDIPAGEARCFAFENHRIGIFRTQDGLFAIANTCPHLDADLHYGVVQDGVVFCPWHHWRFHLDDGRCETGPRFNIACYPVKEEGGHVWVDVAGAHVSDRA